ncbi:MAG TPA: helix-turn-helix transcriptional regulator [Vicinamibacterales bacterium]|nr:helix-turn-helix transcriptional regulator [Vicinamibacterales bacterium]
MKFYRVLLYDQPRGSMRDLARRVGMSYDTLLAIRSGRLVPRPHEVKAIAYVLGCAPEQLMLDVAAPADVQEAAVAR